MKNDYTIPVIIFLIFALINPFKTKAQIINIPCDNQPQNQNNHENDYETCGC